MTQFRWTRHAWDRLGEMGLEPGDVELCIRDAEQTYQQGNYATGRTVYQRGELAVVVGTDDNCIITVLWRQVEDWQRDGYAKGDIKRSERPA